MTLLTHDEARRIGEEMHDRFVAMTGFAPLTRTDQGWADLVQFVTRRGNEAEAARPVLSPRCPHGVLLTRRCRYCEREHSEATA